MKATCTVAVVMEMEKSGLILDTPNIQQTIFADGLLLGYERKGRVKEALSFWLEPVEKWNCYLMNQRRQQKKQVWG